MHSSDNIEITYANVEDLDAILSLIHQLEHFISRETLLNKLEQYHERSDYSLLVAKENKKVVAFAELHFMHFIHEEKRRARLTSFCVDAAYRNNKIGSSFITYIEKCCADKDIYRIEVTSNIRRADAHRFYENKGYTFSSKAFYKYL